MIDPQTLAALEQKNGLPPGLLSAVMKQESGGNPNAVSPKGAKGLFQFMPETAKSYGIDPLDPMQSAEGAARMYGDLSKQFNGDLPSMLAAYNWGSGNLTKQGLANAPAETQNYIKSITGALGQQPEIQQAYLPPQAPLQQFAETAPTVMTDATIDNSAPPAGFDLDAPPSSDIPPAPAGFDLAEPPTGFNLDAPPAEQPQDKSLAGMIGDAWSERNKVNPTVIRNEKGQKTAGSKLRQLGDLAGYVADIPTAGIQYLAENAPEGFKRNASALGQFFGDSPVGDAALSGVNALGELAKENPILAENAGALGNIAALIPARAATSAVGSPIAKAGAALERSAANKNMDFVKELILPKATPSVREDLVGRTKEVGLNRRQEVQLTPQEVEMAEAVAAIPGVKRSNSLQGNANAIQSANRAEAESLLGKLRENDVAIADDDILSGLSKIQDKLAKNPYLSGADASKAATRVSAQALEFIMAQPRTASGLLQARKDLDAWVKSQKPNAFDAADAPVTVAVREVRQGINDLVDASVPDAEVKASLRKQSNLYRAHESIATKAKDEAPTRLGRAAQNIGKGVSLKQGIAGAGVLAGLGATAPALAGPALGAGLALYGAKRALTSPALRKGVGSSLRALGETIK